MRWLNQVYQQLVFQWPSYFLSDLVEIKSLAHFISLDWTWLRACFVYFSFVLLFLSFTIPNQTFHTSYWACFRFFSALKIISLLALALSQIDLTCFVNQKVNFSGWFCCDLSKIKSFLNELLISRFILLVWIALIRISQLVKCFVLSDQRVETQDAILQTYSLIFQVWHVLLDWAWLLIHLYPFKPSSAHFWVYSPIRLIRPFHLREFL